jgi:DNA-binding phage protein
MRGRGAGLTPIWIVELLQIVVAQSNLSEASKAIGISHSMLHRYLRGQGEPTLSTLQKLADYTGQQITIKLKPIIKRSSL